MSGGSGLRFDNYADGEWRMRIGPTDGPEILFVPPLLEEMNRCRALLVAMMRRLAADGFLCTLPDLPGTGESERALGAITWSDWREAVARASNAAITAAIRGGALLDDAVITPHWRFAPVTGASLCRDLERAERAGGARHGGYPLCGSLWDSLQDSTAKPLQNGRTIRLVSDAQLADAKFDGPALWRRSEPGTAPDLADALANDIRDWAGRCGIS